MTFTEKPIELKNETLILNNLRAMFWPKQNALIVSDLHIGKSAHFRRHGIPVSVDVQRKDLDRLSFLVSHYQAKQLIVVGDLFHAEVNTDMDLFKRWRDKETDLEILLIKGNHDRLKAEVYEGFKINCCQDQWDMAPFRFVHEPKLLSDRFVISGHIHPGVEIKSRGRPRLRLPCFQVSASQLILPAFSEFTGLATSKVKKNQIFHAFTETAFFEF
ncbi:ligase-associated DNA damage response endonuclease PdeM [Sediminibacter sp. Hel_I_10]|uniref:ligase-associated DNA damage response endonuclease PdeM n=1 Tax=Sediminibacter sp. Hel_I_10 TaxID=1392490 RepID=UPI00047EA665|nr:ligase-associated DNA damage response endonuclease PdeM [Sediminibacter sp. Hel_I_10]